MTLPILCTATVTTLSALEPTDAIFPETTADYPLAVDLRKLESFAFALAFDATPSNELAIAIGHDANGNGHLDLLEAGFTWGCDCGTWFYADTVTGTVTRQDAASTGTISGTLTIGKRDFKPDWDTLRVTRRGLGEMHEFITTTEKHVYLYITVQ